MSRLLAPSLRRAVHWMVALALTSTGCMTLATNNIARGRSPRMQAVVILLASSLETLIAVGAARAAKRGFDTGMSDCQLKPDAGDDFYTSKNDCTSPHEYAGAAVTFGILAAIDLGSVAYQLGTNEQVFARPQPPVYGGNTVRRPRPLAPVVPASSILE